MNISVGQEREIIRSRGSRDISFDEYIRSSFYERHITCGGMHELLRCFHDLRKLSWRSLVIRPSDIGENRDKKLALLRSDNLERRCLAFSQQRKSASKVQLPILLLVQEFGPEQNLRSGIIAFAAFLLFLLIAILARRQRFWSTGCNHSYLLWILQ